ncbi:MAG: protein tyrosine phosphatase [Rhizobiaceae bacterium]
MSELIVCPLSALDNTLETSRAQWMVSLSAPDKSPPRMKQISGGHLALEFHDITREQDGLVEPQQNHIIELLNFANRWNKQEALLIHCWMGISRSTAAALLVSAHFNPEQDMEKLAQVLREKSPMATPNSRMIALGDGLLNLEGRLITAVANIGRGADAFEGKAFSLTV